MTLGLAFWATDAAGARRQAHDWAAAEPNVERCRVQRVERHAVRETWWNVTVRLTFRQRYEQVELGLSA